MRRQLPARSAHRVLGSGDGPVRIGRVRPLARRPHLRDLRAGHAGACGVTDIARGAGLHIATASRLVEELVGHGWLRRGRRSEDPRGRPVVGARVARVADARAARGGDAVHGGPARRRRAPHPARRTGRPRSALRRAAVGAGRGGERDAGGRAAAAARVVVRAGAARPLRPPTCRNGSWPGRSPRYTRYTIGTPARAARRARRGQAARATPACPGTCTRTRSASRCLCAVPARDGKPVVVAALVGDRARRLRRRRRSTAVLAARRHGASAGRSPPPSDCAVRRRER